MSDLHAAIETLEWDEDASAEDEARALQTLINTGTWKLQGRVGRSMMDAIEAGVCALGHEAAHDYYGNRIPARGEVEPGTVGSVEYVEEHSPYGAVLE
jgi:hypothetical protein